MFVDLGRCGIENKKIKRGVTKGKNCNTGKNDAFFNYRIFGLGQ